VCIHLAIWRGRSVLFLQEYPDMKNMTMNMSSSQPESRLTLTRSRSAFKVLTCTYRKIAHLLIGGTRAIMKLDEKLIKEKVRQRAVVGK